MGATLSGRRRARGMPEGPGVGPREFIPPENGAGDGTLPGVVVEPIGRFRPWSATGTFTRERFSAVNRMGLPGRSTMSPRHDAISLRAARASRVREASEGRRLVRTWGRASRVLICGRCGAFVQRGVPAQFVTGGWKRRLVRCSRCAEGTPPLDLPALPDRIETNAPEAHQAESTRSISQRALQLMIPGNRS